MAQKVKCFQCKPDDLRVDPPRTHIKPGTAVASIRNPSITTGRWEVESNHLLKLQSQLARCKEQ